MVHCMSVANGLRPLCSNLVLRRAEALLTSFGEGDITLFSIKNVMEGNEFRIIT